MSTDLEISILTKAMEDFKEDIKCLFTKIEELPEKMLKYTDERYASKLALEQVKSKINWYAFIFPLATGIIGFLIAILVAQFF